MKATKKFKGMEDKELSFLKKKGASKAMVAHEAKEMKAEKPKEMAMGGFAGLMRRGMMLRNDGRLMKGIPEMMSRMRVNKQQASEIMRGNSPDKGAAIRALMNAKTSSTNSDDFRGSTPKGSFKSALSIFKPGYKQSATSGGAPAAQQQKPNITAAGPNAPTSVMKKGGKVKKMATGGKVDGCAQRGLTKIGRSKEM